MQYQNKQINYLMVYWVNIKKYKLNWYNNRIDKQKKSNNKKLFYLGN